MSKMAFPSLSLTDPHSSEDIRSVIVNENSDTIWAMLVTFGDNTPKFIVSITITQDRINGVQKIDCRYHKIKEIDLIGSTYNKYMYKTAAEEEGLEYDEKSIYMLPIDNEEEMKLALMVFSDGDVSSMNKLFNESNKYYRSFYDAYSNAFSIKDGIVSPVNKDAMSTCEIVVARYRPNLLEDYFTIDSTNIKEFENYRPVLYSYLVEELGKKSKDINQQHKKKSEMPGRLGGLAGIATGLFGAVTGGALQTVDPNVIDKVSKGVEDILTTDKKEEKKEPILRSAKTRDIFSKL